MSWRTSFLKSEYNTWKWRIRDGVSRSWSRITFAFAMQPLKYRVHAFFQRYFFVGLTQRYQREKQAVANAASTLARISARQRLCPHLKGQRFLNMTGAPRPAAPFRDYNASFHRMINNRARVICNYCKRTWWEGDADWSEALRMVQHSTNQPSSSEVPGTVLRGDFPWRQPIKLSFWTRTLTRLKKSFRLGRTGASK